MRRFAFQALSISLAGFLAGGLLSAQNILSNGGFESGLLCYLDNVWSTTGTFGLGDYRLVLSPDAHSGNYSLEISCGGTDCFKAAAISDYIPTTPNQNYILSVYTKCLPGSTATIFLPGTAAGDISTNMNCTGDWAPNTVSFQTAPGAQSFFFYFFSYYGGWARFDDAVLTYGDGTAPTPVTLHPGNRNVSLSSQALVVDGSPYLALGFFNVDYSDLALEAATGANTVFGLGMNQNAACYNTTQEGYLDRAYELGLNFVPDSSTTARLSVPPVFPGVVSKYAPHLANIAWMLTDEPDQANVPFWFINPSTLVAEYSASKTQTTLPIFADFQHAAYDVPSVIAPYTPGVDFFMGEPYGPDFQYLAHAANLFKSLSPARPMWFAQDNPDASLIVPKAYYAVVNGGTGIGYFDWETFKANPPQLAAASQAFAELGQLKNVIFGQNVDALVTASTGIGYNARYQAGSAYILAVNPVPQNVVATFQMSGLAAGQTVQVMFENRSVAASAGSFTDTFAGVARHVYVVSAPLTAIAGTILSTSGPDSARDWKIQIVNSGLSTASGTNIASVKFVQTGGTACKPAAVSPLPLLVGDIAPGSSATGDLILNFTGCDTSSKFSVDIGLSANGGNVTNTMIRNNQRK